MDVFNKYLYGAAIMLAATFKNMGNPVASRFVWIQIDEFLQKRKKQKPDEGRSHHEWGSSWWWSSIEEACAGWTKRWLKSEATPDVAVI